MLNCRPKEAMKYILILVVLESVVLGGCKRQANTYTVVEAHVGTDDGQGNMTPATYVIRHGNVTIHAECNTIIPTGGGLAPCPPHPNVPIGEPLLMTASESRDSMSWTRADGTGVIFRVLREKQTN